VTLSRHRRALEMESMLRRRSSSHHITTRLPWPALLLAAILAAVCLAGTVAVDAAVGAVPTGYWVDVDESGTTTSGNLGGGGSLAATGTGNVNYGYAQECAPSSDGGPFSSDWSTCAALGRAYNSSGSPEQPSGFWFTGNQHCVNAGHSLSGSTFTWHVQLPETGHWHVDVYVPTWTSYGWGNQYILSSDSGQFQNYPFIQQAYHGQWVSLFGSYTFTANQDYTVQLTPADGSDPYCHYQMADQMRWVFDGPSTTPPVNTSPPMILGLAEQGQMLTAIQGTWTNEPTSYHYQWERCDNSGSSCSPISGATSQSYTLVAGDVGHTIVFDETAANTGGAGNAAASPATPLVALPFISTSSGKIPTNQKPPIILDSPVEGKTLTALNGIWDDFLATLQDQWLRCDAADSSHCAVIAGATGLTYVPTALDVGHALEVQETASNAAGKSAAVNSSPTSVARTSLGGCVAGAIGASVARAASHASAHRLPVATASRAGRRTRPRHHRRVSIVHDVVFARGHDQIVVSPGRTLDSAYYHFEVPASQPFADMPEVHLDPIEIDSRSRRIFLRFSAPGSCNVILTGVFPAARLRVSARRRTFSLSLSAPLTTLGNGTPSGSFVYHLNGRVGVRAARAASNSGGAGGVSLSPSAVLDVYANVLSVAGGEGKIASATATLPAVEKGGGGQAATNPEEPVGSTYKGQTSDDLSISLELNDNKSAIKHVDVSLPTIPCLGTIWEVLAGDESDSVSIPIVKGNLSGFGESTQTYAGSGLPAGYNELWVTGVFSPSAVEHGVTVQQIHGAYQFTSYGQVGPVAGHECPHTGTFVASVAVTSQ
jgi:hypothetical protein